jgi:hypothetical protein
MSIIIHKPNSVSQALGRLRDNDATSLDDGIYWLRDALALTPDFEEREGLPEIERTLVLSTAHVPARLLRANKLDLRHWRCQGHEHGFTVFLASKQDHEQPEVPWFQEVLPKARKMGCYYLNFDSDGSITPGFPIYEEEYWDGGAEHDVNDGKAKISGGVTVKCKLCGDLVLGSLAHLHQGEWVGDAEDCGCWDERLRMTE